MTPKRPEATCLIAERIESPFGSGRKRSASSPPSPVFDLPPIRFMAMASVVCASREIEPNDMAPVEKRLHDLGRRLDLLERHRLAPVRRRVLDVEQAADGEEALILLVDARREGAVLVRAVAAHRVLQVADRLGVPDVVLAAEAEGVLAADVERGAVDRRIAEGVAVAPHRLLGDLGQADALDRRRRAEEVAVDELRGQADGVEDLRAAIGLVGRDAHLGHHLEQALADRLDVALDHLLGLDLDRQLAALVHVEHRLEGEVGVDRLGAVAGKAGEMVHLARLAGLDDEPDRGAQALADQVVVHRRRREQRRDRNAVGADEPVRQDDDVVAAVHGGLGAVAEAVERAVQRRRALLGRIGDVERLRVEVILDMADAADLLEVLVGQDRLAHLEALAARGALEVEDVRPRPDEGDEAHDELLADRVDRRVRHLGEVLLEVGVEQLRLDPRAPRSACRCPSSRPPPGR